MNFHKVLQPSLFVLVCYICTIANLDICNTEPIHNMAATGLKTQKYHGKVVIASKTAQNIRVPYL